MPWSADIDPYYWDFGNGFIPFFLVVGNHYWYMYGDNPVGGAIAKVPDAILSFTELMPWRPVGGVGMLLGDTVEIDLSEAFLHPYSDPFDLTVDQNTNPSVASTLLDGTNLTIEALEIGSTDVTILADDGTRLSATQEFTVSVYNPDDQNILIVDLDPTSTGTTLKSSIENFYTESTVDIVYNLDDAPLPTAEAVFLLLGIFSNNYSLTEDDVGPLVSYLNGGGNLYMEGGDTWAYDTQTTLHNMFNIDGTSDGSGNCGPVEGMGFLEGYNWTYSGENNYIDHLQPIGDASVVFHNTSPSYNNGIAYDSGTYKTVGTSFEITGLGGTNSLDNAVFGILEFFGVVEAPELNPPANVAVDDETGLVTWDTPPQTMFFDDFEDYMAGGHLCVQSDDWNPWSNNPGGSDDAYVSDEQAYSGVNSVLIDEGSASDIIHLFGDLTTGVYDVSIWLYMEPGYGGYYNLLHNFTEWARDKSRTSWAQENYFGDDGTGYTLAGNDNIPFTYPQGEWFECKTNVDLDSDWAVFYVDGTMVHEWQWSIGASGGGSLQLGAIDIYAAAPTGDSWKFYFDDFRIGTAAARELESYNVYLDGYFFGNTTETEYQLTGLVNGQSYTVGVSAEYTEGESEIVEVGFTYTGTGSGHNLIPAVTELGSNYPNPFNPTTNIAFALSQDTHVKIEIYNAKGQKVVVLTNEFLPAGNHVVTWEGTDMSGKPVDSGIYMYRMQADKYTDTKKMILLK